MQFARVKMVKWARKWVIRRLHNIFCGILPMQSEMQYTAYPKNIYFQCLFLKLQFACSWPVNWLAIVMYEKCIYFLGRWNKTEEEEDEKEIFITFWVCYFENLPSA